MRDVIFIGIGLNDNNGKVFAATTKTGLAESIGVRRQVVSGGLRGNGIVEDVEFGTWRFCEVAVKKVGGARGRHNSTGFRGMKGDDGLLRAEKPGTDGEV